MSTSTSWYLLPNGTLQALTRTQELLVDLVPVVEDMNNAYQELLGAVADSVRRRAEARRLIVDSRRQRLGLQLVATREVTEE